MYIGLSTGITGQSAPVILGQATVGATLTLGAVPLSGMSPIAYSVRWLRDGVEIAGATAAEYTSVSADIGHEITAVITRPDNSELTTSNAVLVQDAVSPLLPTPPYIASQASVSVTDSGAAVTYTYIEPSVTGTAPITITPVLTRDGSDVTGDMNGLSYTVAKTAEAQALVMTFTASNSVAPAATSVVTATVPAVVSSTVAPSFVTAALVSPASGPVGTTFTFAEGVVTGVPSPTLNGVLELDGVDVTADMVGLTYTSTSEGTLTWTVTAQNGVAPNAVSATSATVTSSATTIDLLAATSSIRFPEGNRGDSDVPDTHRLLLRQSSTNMGDRPWQNTMWMSSFFAFVRLPEAMRTGGQAGNVDSHRSIFGDSETRLAQSGTAIYGDDDGDGGQALFPTGEDAALVVFHTSLDDTGGTRALRFDIYSLIDGSVTVGSTDATNPSGTWDAMLNIGAAGSGVPGDSDTTRYELWNGEIAAMGVISGPTHQLPAQNSGDDRHAYWRRVAMGEDIQSVIYDIEADGKVWGSSYYPRLLWYRDFDGTVSGLDVPDAVPVPQGHVPYHGEGASVGVLQDTATAATQVEYGTLKPGSDFVPRDGKLAVLDTVCAPGTVSPERLSPGVVVGIVPGDTSRTVSFSGRGIGYTDGDAVEVRLIYRDTGEIALDWTSMGVVSSEAWSGTATVPLSNNGWLVTQLRIDGEVWNNRDPWGVGYKVVQLGQSQTNIYLSATDGSTTMADENLSTVSYLTGSPGSWFLRLLNPMSETDSLNVFVDQLRSLIGDVPVMVVHEAINGTGQLAFVTDSDTSRNWSAFQNKLDAYGNDVSVVLKNWGTNDMTISPYADVLDALIEGSGPSAGDHSLNAALQTGWVMGISPLSRHTAAASSTGVGTYSGNATSTRREEVTYANDNGHVVGPPVSDFEIESVGGPHQLVSGSKTMGERMAITLAKAVGATAPAQPYFTTAQFNADRSQITISVALPNGGSLSSPAPTALRSFTVRDGASGDYETGSAAGFTAAISGNTVVLTKDSGTWTAGSAVSYLSNLEDRDDDDAAEETAIIDGALYESWSDSRLGLGLPVMGSQSGGNWVPDWFEPVSD